MQSCYNLLPHIPRSYCRQSPFPALLALGRKRNVWVARPKRQRSDKISDPFEMALQSSGILPGWPRSDMQERLISRDLPLGWIDSDMLVTGQGVGVQAGGPAPWGRRGAGGQWQPADRAVSPAGWVLSCSIHRGGQGTATTVGRGSEIARWACWDKAGPRASRGWRTRGPWHPDRQQACSKVGDTNTTRRCFLTKEVLERV